MLKAISKIVSKRRNGNKNFKFKLYRKMGLKKCTLGS